MVIKKNQLDMREWEKIYDKYSIPLFTLICNLTDDRIIAEEIFTETFVRLKDRLQLSEANYSLCAQLMRHTYITAMHQLKRNGIKPKVWHSPEETKLIHLLCTQCNSLHEVALMMNITKDQAKKKLHENFLYLTINCVL